MDNNAHALRCDNPRFGANVTCWRRTGAPTIIFRDLLHRLDFEVPLGQQLLQPGFLLPQLTEFLHIVGVHAAETLPTGIDRLFADAVPLGHLGHRIAAGFSQDAYHLLFRKL